MSNMQAHHKYEQYWQILEYNREMIKFSEVKAGLVITIFGILFSLILSSVEWIRGEIPDWHIVLIVLGITFIITTLGALYYAFKCFIPRFENNALVSVIYFGDVMKEFARYQDYHEYLEKIADSDESMSLQIAEQIHTNSRIAAKKMAAVNMAMRFMMVAVSLLIVIVGLIVIT